MQIFNPPSAGAESPLVITSNGATEKPLTLRASVGQSVYLLDFQNSSGTSIAGIGMTGGLMGYYPTSGSGYAFLTNDSNYFIASYGYGSPRAYMYYPLSYGRTNPAQITANVNDWSSIGSYGGKFICVNSSGAFNITGISINGASSQTDGDNFILLNNGANNITLTHEDALSTASNRFLNSTGANIVLSPNQAVDLIYDGTVSRWRAFKRN